MKIHYSLTPEDYSEYQELYLARIAGFWQKHHVEDVGMMNAE